MILHRVLRHCCAFVLSDKPYNSVAPPSRLGNSTENPSIIPSLAPLWQGDFPYTAGVIANTQAKLLLIVRPLFYDKERTATVKHTKRDGAIDALYLEFYTMKTNNPAVQLIKISDEEAGQRIDNFLLARLKGVPKSMIYRIVRKGEVRVNKGRIKAEYKVAAGDIVRIPPVRVAERENAPISVKLDKVAALADCILYEDEHLLLLNKPSGTAVHGGSGLSFGVIEALRALRPQARFLELVHRLDRDTSGVLMVAKKRSALRLLHEQLRLKGMQKDYMALVRGQWQSHCKVVHAPLLKNILQSGERVVCVSSEGKPSETRFSVEERFDYATLVKASPITGRTHQIRVHALHAGHPIAFDDRYGDAHFDRQLLGTGLNRLFLHAAMLRFEHPATGEMMCIKAPMDDELRHCLQVLRKNNAANNRS